MDVQLLGLNVPLLISLSLVQILYLTVVLHKCSGWFCEVVFRTISSMRDGNYYGNSNNLSSLIQSLSVFLKVLR